MEHDLLLASDSAEQRRTPPGPTSYPAPPPPPLINPPTPHRRLQAHSFHPSRLTPAPLSRVLLNNSACPGGGGLTPTPPRTPPPPKPLSDWANFFLRAFGQSKFFSGASQFRPKKLKICSTPSTPLTTQGLLRGEGSPPQSPPPPLDPPPLRKTLPLPLRAQPPLRVSER